jgi:hypothetical protein
LLGFEVENVSGDQMLDSFAQQFFGGWARGGTRSRAEPESHKMHRGVCELVDGVPPRLRALVQVHDTYPQAAGFADEGRKGIPRVRSVAAHRVPHRAEIREDLHVHKVRRGLDDRELKSARGHFIE